MLVFEKNLSLMEFQVIYLVLFLLFSVIAFVILNGKFHKNIQLTLKFFKAPFLVLHFSYSTLTTFLIVLSVILLSMLMILLSSLSEIRHLICGNSYIWFLNVNQIYKTLWTWAGSGFLISTLEKFNWFCLTSLIILVLVI